jgi:hypothetical protein
MTKRVLLLLLAAFAFFTLVGFLFARGSFLIINEMGEPTPNQALIPKANQPTLLLIRVNDLSIQKPSVLSIWAAVFSQGNSPQVILKALYPMQDQATASALAFELGEDGLLSPWSMYELNVFNIHWDGYVLFDSSGLQWLADTLITSSSLNTKEEMIMPQTIQEPIPEETSWYQDLCKLFPLQAKSPAWSEITPSHLRSDLAVNTGEGFWRTLQKPDITCLVVTP